MSDRIRQPRQERSQATMIRILDAFEKLLRKDSCEAITINDIANESSTGSGSICLAERGTAITYGSRHSLTRQAGTTVRPIPRTRLSLAIS